jgi:hypothetical protein
MLACGRIWMNTTTAWWLPAKLWNLVMAVIRNQPRLRPFERPTPWGSLISHLEDLRQPNVRLVLVTFCLKKVIGLSIRGDVGVFRRSDVREVATEVVCKRTSTSLPSQAMLISVALVGLPDRNKAGCPPDLSARTFLHPHLHLPLGLLA